MTGNEIRRKFLHFFEDKGHLILPSASLIPKNDPTLLLIGAGMAPFKPFFTGKMKPPRTRITTSQKCVRTGDIENVGRTARHQTFFEMLGNFSFGDYFKNEAIAWAWEFVTKELSLPKDKLYVTIHTEDDEAYDIWHDDIGIADDHIVRLEDNFWEIGTGPCGPCSEIYIDLGAERGCGSPDCAVGCDCDRYLEIWNLVFTQYNRDEDGNYTPLVQKNIDTGAGLERLASVIQNKPSNFETDLIFPLIEYMEKISGVAYGSTAAADISLKVIADHIRSLTVMIADGVLPSNEGRGYVLRRILRRAVRHARLLGVEKMFLSDMVDVVLSIFDDAYPELQTKREYIKKVIQLEEQRFQETLAQGTELLNNEIAGMKAAAQKTLSGDTAFKLYDTFGFPWELTQEILDEQGLELDKKGFDTAMQAQRDRARTARQENDKHMLIPDLSGVVADDLKLDETADKAAIALLLQDGKVVEEAHDGDEVAVILTVTPFHAEGGGQVGASGTIKAPLGTFTVDNTLKLPDGTVYELGIIADGLLRTGDAVELIVDKARQQHIARNHTATHLLQAALKQVLGSHVNQAGSYVDDERLRFDFSHFAPIDAEQLLEVEKIVNDTILTDLPVSIIETSQELAREMGATALFGEKYGDVVRVVSAGDFSRELCGGTHVASTGKIGSFRIIGESGIGAGLRRIEAVTGVGALQYAYKQEHTLAMAADLLKTRAAEVPERLEAVLDNEHKLEKVLMELNAKLAKSQAGDLLAQKQLHNGVAVIVGEVRASDMEDLRSIGDMVRDKLTEPGVVILGAANGDKVNFVAMANKTAVVKGIHAGKIVKEAAAAAGGGGGGRPDMAQAGGRMPEQLPAALQKAATAAVQMIK